MIPAARILALTGTTHPKALVQTIDLTAGRVVFAWLDANDQPVDSGGSVASFPPAEEDPGDAVLTAAIQAPAASGARVIALTPLEIRTRMTIAEKVALDTSIDPFVTVVRNDLIAAQEVKSDDPRTEAGKQILIANGILTAERAAVVFA